MKFKVLIVTSLTLAIASFSINAKEEEVTYSTEGYCLLEKAGEQSGFLKAYAKKLGNVPSKSVCRSFFDFVKQAKPKDWDYRGGKPYPGSLIRLSAAQIKKLRAAKKEN